MSLLEMIPRYMALPSTICTGFLLYVIIFHTPNSMKYYKKILIIMAVAVYQFDIVYGLFVMLTPIEKALGCQIKGFLGSFYPKYSRIWVVLAVACLCVLMLSIILGFVYRENTLMKNAHKARNTSVLEMLIASLLVILQLIAQFFTQPDYSVILEYLKANNITFDPNFGVFVMIPTKMDIVYVEAVLAVFLFSTVAAIVTKSIHTVNVMLADKRQHMSPQTINLHKMLMRSLIWQGLAPLLLIGVPSILLGLVTAGFILLPFRLDPDSNWWKLGEYMTAAVLVMPSLFSPIHDLFVIVFTTPYKKAFLRLMKCGKMPVTMVKPSSTVVSRLSFAN